MPGQTTKDKQFTLEDGNCLGCCALGPVMVVDGTYYGKMTASKVDRILKKHADGGVQDGNGQTRSRKPQRRLTMTKLQKAADLAVLA